MSVDKPGIDLGYRPQSYFWPITHDTHLIGAIKGERRRKAIRAAFGAQSHPHPERRRPPRARTPAPLVHGGEYQPDRRASTGSSTASSTSTTGETLTAKRTRSLKFCPQSAARIRMRIDGWYAEGGCHAIGSGRRTHTRHRGGQV